MIIYINAVSLIDSPSFSLAYSLSLVPLPSSVDDRYNVRFNNTDDDENEDDNDRGEEE